MAPRPLTDDEIDWLVDRRPSTEVEAARLLATAIAEGRALELLDGFTYAALVTLDDDGHLVVLDPNGFELHGGQPG